MLDELSRRSHQNAAPVFRACHPASPNYFEAVLPFMELHCGLLCSTSEHLFPSYLRDIPLSPVPGGYLGLDVTFCFPVRYSYGSGAATR